MWVFKSTLTAYMGEMITDEVKYYSCGLCRVTHFDDEGIYGFHRMFQQGSERDLEFEELGEEEVGEERERRKTA